MSKNKLRKIYFLEGEERTAICRVAMFVSVVFMIVAVVLLLETFLIPVANMSMYLLIMGRNLLTVAALVALSLFLDRWSKIYSKRIKVSRNMAFYKFLTVLVAIFGVIKSVVSAFFSIYYLVLDNMVGIYFAAEAIAWMALAVFFIIYSRKLVRDWDFIRRDVYHHDAQK